MTVSANRLAPPARTRACRCLPATAALLLRGLLVLAGGSAGWCPAAGTGLPCGDGLLALQTTQGRACAELASTEDQREQGLMFRTRLGADQGMLFVFPHTEPYRMWMKNTLVPLSVAFLDDEGRIINIEDMEPATLTPHGAQRPARYALEMRQGWFGGHHWVPGLQVVGLPPGSIAR